MEEVYYQDSEEFLARQRRMSKLVHGPIVVVMLLLMAIFLTPILSRTGDWRYLVAFVTIAPNRGSKVTMAALNLWRFQSTRVTNMGIEPPLRRYRTILRRERERLASRDIERIRKVWVLNRCCEVIMRDRLSDTICEHNVEDFDRFYEALKLRVPWDRGLKSRPTEQGKPEIPRGA